MGHFPRGLALKAFPPHSDLIGDSAWEWIWLEFWFMYHQEAGHLVSDGDDHSASLSSNSGAPPKGHQWELQWHWCLLDLGHVLGLPLGRSVLWTCELATQSWAASCGFFICGWGWYQVYPRALLGGSDEVRTKGTYLAAGSHRGTSQKMLFLVLFLLSYRCLYILVSSGIYPLLSKSHHHVTTWTVFL